MNLLVFDETIVGTATVYTSPTFNDQLGSIDRWAIMVVVDTVSGTSPTVTVQSQHSGDQGVNWKDKSGTAEVNAQSLVTTTTNVFVGSDAGSTPTLGGVRLKITLGGTSPQGHTKIWFTGRDDG